MRIIEIKASENGAHGNHTYHGVLPEGWAIVPDSLVTENFPFGEIVVEEIDGAMTVTQWVPGVMPEPLPEVTPDVKPDEETSVWDELDAAYQEGVDSV